MTAVFSLSQRSGITFGVIWGRTKNLLALALVHAAGDLLPNFADFLKIW